MHSRLGSTVKIGTIIALAAALSACSSYNGTWPRLGPSAQDAQPTMEESTQTSSAPEAAQTTVPAAQTSETQSIRSRIAQAAVNFEDAKRRATLQRRAVSAALDKADSVTGSSWSLAQLELSRLNQIDSELVSLRADTSAIAGDVAALSARGITVTGLLSQTGTLINKINQALVENKETKSKARGTLAS